MISGSECLVLFDILVSVILPIANRISFSSGSSRREIYCLSDFFLLFIFVIATKLNSFFFLAIDMSDFPLALAFDGLPTLVSRGLR